MKVFETTLGGLSVGLEGFLLARGGILREPPFSAHAVDVAEHMVDLIEFRERLLHAVQLLGGIADQLAAMAHEEADRHDFLRGDGRLFDPSSSMELLQPLCIASVRLAPRYPFDVLSVDHQDINASGIEPQGEC